jgi:hypothetical protein
VLDDEQVERLAHLSGTLQQGDVIRVNVLTTVGAPEATYSEETREAGEVADFRVTSVERRLSSGLWAIVTQTCDIRRDADVEPFLHLAPLVDAPSPELWEDLRRGGRSSRFYAYPVVFDTVDVDRPLLDIRVIQTIERAALVAETVDPKPIRFDPKERQRLSTWLAHRFARHAFPDDLEEQILGPLRRSCRDRLGKNSEAGALLEVREAIFVRYSEATVEITFVLAQDRTLRHTQFAGDQAKTEKAVKAGLAQLMKPVAVSAGKTDPAWSVTWRAVFPESVPLSDVLYDLHPVAID